MVRSCLESTRRQVIRRHPGLGPLGLRQEPDEPTESFCCAIEVLPMLAAGARPVGRSARDDTDWPSQLRGVAWARTVTPPKQDTASPLAAIARSMYSGAGAGAEVSCRSFDLVGQEHLKTRSWFRESARSVEKPRTGRYVLRRASANRTVGARVTLRTPVETRTTVFECIEGWYNPTRRHSSLDYVSPIAFERQARPSPAGEPTGTEAAA